MRKSKKTLAILAIIAMVLMMIPVQAFADTTSATNRLADVDRVGTAIAIANNGWTTASTVIVAPADDANLVDALAVAPLAGQDNAPILMTYKAGLDAKVAAEIATLKATKVIAVGALSDATVAQLQAISGVTVTSVKGADRFETAAKIAAMLTSPAGTFVVAYNGLADALSAASFAAANKYAIMIADTNGSLPASETVVGSKTYTVGGQVAAITGATPFAGADRYATNDAVLKGLTYKYDKVYVANGETLVDALAGSALAAKTQSPIILANTTGATAAAGVNAKLTASSQVIAFGGSAVVPDAVVGSVSYTAPVSTALAVQSVSAINLNQIKVTFSQPVDETSAEKVGNYAIDGTVLTDGTGATDTNVASLQSDNQTVIITLGTPYAQYKKVTFTVKKAVYSKDMLKVVPSVDNSITFSDVTVPTVASVSVSGNTKLDVKFSEAVQLQVSDVASWQINGQSLSNFAYDSSKTVLDDNGKNSAGTTSYTDEVELYFNTALPLGDNTLTVPAGSATVLHDAAGFLTAKTPMTFTVQNVTDAPTITSVTGDDSGTLYVTYNRAMDKATATQTATYYKINGNALGGSATIGFKSNTGSTVVKIAAGSGAVNTGANVLWVSKEVKDTYGNKLSDDQYVSFTVAKDTTAPTVTSVTVLDKNTIRVQFSEDVSAAYASNKGNYKLLDSSASDITSNINKVQDPTGSTTTDGDTWDIKFLDANALTGSSYTLTIKNIVDLAGTPNSMADYTTTINGNDTVAPSVTSVTTVSGKPQKVAIFFSESMDNASITTAANYAYTDGGNNIKALPASATITAGDSNKSVVIEFPSNFTVVTAANDGNTSHVAKIRISNVKDAAGNVLDVIATTQDIKDYSTVDNSLKPQMSTDTLKLAYNGSNVQATIQYNQAINTLNIADWKVGSDANGWVSADSGYISGKNVILTFTTSGTISLIKASGVATQIKTVAAQSSNIAGVPILNDGTQAQTVYDYSLQPKVKYTSGNIVADASAATTSASITFDEAVDNTINGMYTDDFSFIDTTSGTVLTVQTVDASSASGKVIFYFKQSISKNDKISIRALSGNVNIRSKKDRDGNYAAYVPSSDDLSVNTISVGD